MSGSGGNRGDGSEELAQAALLRAKEGDIKRLAAELERKTQQVGHCPRPRMSRVVDVCWQRAGGLHSRRRSLHHVSPCLLFAHQGGGRDRVLGVQRGSEGM